MRKDMPARICETVETHAHTHTHKRPHTHTHTFKIMQILLRKLLRGVVVGRERTGSMFYRVSDTQQGPAGRGCL